MGSERTSPKKHIATVGYSGKSLSEKLGLKITTVGQILNPPKDVLPLYGTLPAGVKTVRKLSGTNEFIHLYVSDAASMTAAIDNAREHLTPNGMIWVSWPKKASGVKTDLSDIVIRDYALARGLVDIKVCAVSDIWSGLKFVIPVAQRQSR